MEDPAGLVAEQAVPHHFPGFEFGDDDGDVVVGRFTSFLFFDEGDEGLHEQPVRGAEYDELGARLPAGSFIFELLLGGLELVY